MVGRSLTFITMLMLRCLATQSFRPLSYSSTTTAGCRIPYQSARFFTTTTTSTTRGMTPRKSTRARQKARKESREAAGTTLEWETFEFSDSPKWDKRFGEDADIHMLSSEEEWEKVEEREAAEDKVVQEKFERQHKLWEELDPELVKEATNILLPFVSPERWERIQSIMKKRTQQTRFLFENPSNPSNVWACLRTLDSFGIQHVDLVIQSGKYKGKAALSQKRGMRTAMGSAKWLTLKNYMSTRHALETMKEEGYHIVCTDVNPTSKDIRDFDWDASNKKVCVIMGNEQYGISDDVKELADESFYLPMVGMAESFNLSVATSITCAHLSAASSQEGKGPLRSGDISEKEYKTLLLKGALNSIRHKTAQALFRKHGLKFPNEMNLT